VVAVNGWWGRGEGWGGGGRWEVGVYVGGDGGGASEQNKSYHDKKDETSTSFARHYSAAGKQNRK
jgi:hypothetical protein